MIRLLLTVLSLVIVLPTSHAQQSEPHPPQWRAQWIWLQEGEAADMMLARRVFTLTKVPERATLAITASSRYQLYVNGSYIGSGPARCAPHHQAYDVLDIADALRAGENALAIRVHFQCEGVSYYGASRAGLLAQLDFPPDTDAPVIQTDDSWRLAPDDSWMNESPRMAVFHIDVCDRVDLRRKIKDWAAPECDDSGWKSGRVLRRDSGWPTPQADELPAHLVLPWTDLVPRHLPPLKESVIDGGRSPRVAYVAAEAFDAENWTAVPPLKKLRCPQTIPSYHPLEGSPISPNPPGEQLVLVYDLGQVHNARPFLDVVGPAGAVVDIMAAPYLLDGAIQSPIVASTYTDRIVLSGERERWEAFYMKPVRWLAVIFRHMPAKGVVYEAGVLSVSYPFQETGFFHAPEFPELETLFHAAGRTLRVCTTDAYTDNYRERRQYAQTSFYASMANYAIFGDYPLQRRYLTQIAEEQIGNGLMPAYAPRHGDDFMVILDSNCFWISGLHQYLLHSGDDDTARALLPAARKLLDFLHTYTDGLGLLDNPPYPYWLDHALLDRRGANFCLNALYLSALEDFAQVLDWLGEEDADTYREAAHRMRPALREQFWDPKVQLFADAVVDGVRSNQFSEQSNALALALNIASTEQAKAVVARLATDEPHDFVRRRSGLVMVTPPMSYFFHAGLCEAGRLDESLELLWSRFGHMLTPGSSGTLWEEWWLDGTGRSGALKPYPSGRSDAQTESVFPPALFVRYVLGIEPTQPGIREVTLHYHASRRLHQREGAIPTPHGLLKVVWDVTPTEFGIRVQSPGTVRVNIDLGDMGNPDRSAILLNGTIPPRDRLDGDLLTLDAGESDVRIRKHSE